MRRDIQRPGEHYTQVQREVGEDRQRFSSVESSDFSDSGPEDEMAVLVLCLTLGALPALQTLHASSLQAHTEPAGIRQPI